MTSKHKTLTVEEKIKVIEEHEKNKRPAKELTVLFKVGKTQIYDILKNKIKIKDEWVKGTAGHVKRITKSTDYDEINRAMFEWFVSARAKGIPISGPLIQTEALETARKLGKHNFKASNGWLESFKHRHNIVFNAVCGEANDVDMQTVADWKGKIEDLVAGYEPRNVYNGDETGLFFRVLPSKTLTVRGDKCTGGKLSKERLTLFICANMAGEIEKPIVIGKSACPRPFRHLDRNSLPVNWRSNKKAWMTSAIMEEWILSFNGRMKSQGRKVILFLDNATCHPRIDLSNVKLAYFPPNTTSITQPIDQGIIYTLKSFYRKFVLQSLVAKINTCTNVSQLVKQINVLDAVNWIHQAKKKILPETVKKCFLKAGFPAHASADTQDVTVENLQAISDLCKQGNLPDNAEDVVNFDNELATTEDIQSAADIAAENSRCEVMEEMDDDDEGNERELKIRTFGEALSVVSDLQEFAASKNVPELLELMQDAKEIIQRSLVKKSRQCTLKDMWGQRN